MLFESLLSKIPEILKLTTGAASIFKYINRISQKINKRVQGLSYPHKYINKISQIVKKFRNIDGIW